MKQKKKSVIDILWDVYHTIPRGEQDQAVKKAIHALARELKAKKRKKEKK